MDWWRRILGIARMARDAGGDNAKPAAQQLPVQEQEQERLRARNLALLSNGAWCVDSIEERDGGIHIAGWAIAPGRDIDSLGFTLNGRVFDEVEFPLPREDLERLFWYTASGGVCAFRGRVDGALVSSADADGVITLSFVDRATLAPLREDHNYYLDASDLSCGLPPAQLRTRVHGAPSEAAFRLEGFSNFVKLERAMRRATGHGYEAAGRVLDWGVGCGRFSRYFPRHVPQARVTGADIDHDAIAWVTANLPVEGMLLPFHPPSALPSSAFDLLIGISIFTHLGEAEQFEWLAELQRVAAPGAVLLMTTHGDAAVSRQGWSLGKLERWLETGFFAAATPELDEVVNHVEPGYYKSTCHTTDYIRQHWSRYFEIVEIVQGYAGNLQDLVVMAKR